MAFFEKITERKDERLDWAHAETYVALGKPRKAARLLLEAKEEYLPSKALLDFLEALLLSLSFEELKTLEDSLDRKYFESFLFIRRSSSEESA